jgi:hypothetical protein
MSRDRFLETVSATADRIGDRKLDGSLGAFLIRTRGACSLYLLRGKREEMREREDS